MPRTQSRFGDRSFNVAGPDLWNGLSTPLSQPDVELDHFKQLYSKHLFYGCGALWLLFIQQHINYLTYLPTYLCKGVTSRQEATIINRLRIGQNDKAYNICSYTGGNRPSRSEIYIICGFSIKLSEFGTFWHMYLIWFKHYLLVPEIDSLLLPTFAWWRVRELTSGFDFSSCSHLRVALLHFRI